MPEPVSLPVTTLTPPPAPLPVMVFWNRLAMPLDWTRTPVSLLVIVFCHSRTGLVAGEVLAGQPLEADVGAVDGVAGVGDGAWSALECDVTRKARCRLSRRVVAGRQVEELVVADGDVAGVGVAVLPDAEDAWPGRPPGRR